MAIYHLSVSNVSRASGSKATATLSYISGRRVHDERRGAYDYGRKERDVLRVGTLLPEGAPAEYADPAVLFNAVELHETGRTARPAKKIVVALPREFTPRQRVQALEEYIRENLNADGYAATYAIHDDGRGNNPHAHILVANRQIDPATGGWARLKQRMEYVLDERGERVPLIDPETGRQKTDKRGRRQWKRTSVSLNPLDRKAKLKALRESWANTCNARLDETARIDHRSLEDQGSDLEPTIHEGYAARAIERAGGVSERCQTNREIRRSNSLLTAVRAELGRIFDRLGELFAAKIGRLRRRQARPEPAEPNWRYFEGDARRQLEADKADHTAAIRGKLMDARADVGNREKWWRSHGHRGARGRQADHRRGAGGLARGQGREHLQARQAAAERRAGGRRAVREAARGGAVARRRRHPGRLGPGQQVPHEDHQGHLRPRHAAEDQASWPNWRGGSNRPNGRERTAKPRTGEGPRTAYGRTTRAGGEPDAGHETARTVRRRAAGPQRARGLGRGQPVRITPGPQDQGRPAQRDQTAHGQAHRPAGGANSGRSTHGARNRPKARTRPLEQLSGVLRMMFAVASVKRAETAFPGLHGAVEVVTRGRHVEQLSGREHLAVPGDASSNGPHPPPSSPPRAWRRSPEGSRGRT
uniref:Putative mobilization protein n=1 Tax=Bifidobacterium longum TaxID=216816 RepID=Q53EJ2_BIFLN|nr:putative mobilization protein [Bifidobacterium longum]